MPLHRKRNLTDDGERSLEDILECLHISKLGQFSLTHKALLYDYSCPSMLVL